MKKLFNAVIVGSFILTSCEKEKISVEESIKTEQRSVSGFSKIEVQGNTNLIIKQGNSFKVEATAYGNLLPLLETKVTGDNLKIGYKSGSVINNDNSEVAITMPVLNKLNTSGQGSITIQNGATSKFEANIIGASTIKAFGFSAQNATVKVEGSGTAELSVTDNLQAKIIGSGKVIYKGNPKSVTSDITGSGKVQAATIEGSKTIDVDKNTKHINVMGNEVMVMPSFPSVKLKAGKVCGYVKDWAGNPLTGATIGVRSTYYAGHYSGSTAKTDSKGYYELTPPKGSVHFYNAGYQIKYSTGLAAVSLHPTDGNLESWTSSDGKVENFVLLPYGIASKENVQNNPQLPTSYYGGAIILNWYGVEADDENAPNFAIKEGSVVEITLSTEGKPLNGTTEKNFVIRKIANTYGELRIHNIPLGLYRIGIKVNGKAVKMKDTRKQNQAFGLNPAEATGSASLGFLPNTADATMIAPQVGAWEWVNLYLEAIEK
jgi:hypothetical protein